MELVIALKNATKVYNYKRLAYKVKAVPHSVTKGEVKDRISLTIFKNMIEP